jgi:hypothetical protein
MIIFHPHTRIRAVKEVKQLPGFLGAFHRSALVSGQGLEIIPVVLFIEIVVFIAPFDPFP